MPKKGTYGNKHIFVLHADGEHHHKHKCIYFQKDENYCNYKMTKCFGSANCEHYKEKYLYNLVNSNSIETHNSTLTAKHQEECSISKNDSSQLHKTDNEKVKSLGYSLPGHYPSFGEKLINKLVVIKKINVVIFGVVIFEDHDYITIEMDSGTSCKFDRKTAIKQKSIWVVDKIKDL